MKRFISFVVMMLFAFGMVSCSQQEQSKEWSEQEILTMFESNREESWDIIDCVLIPDYAYDMVGAVLFWDNENETSNVAFLDADGHYQKCGTHAKTAAEANFSYFGNGALTYKLTTDDGTVYNYMLTISIDGSDVQFKAEDDLPK